MSQPTHEPAAQTAPRQSQESGDEASAHGEISSEQLLGGKAEVLIRHGPELYRLRLTRNGKLILQK